MPIPIKEGAMTGHDERLVEAVARKKCVDWDGLPHELQELLRIDVRGTLRAIDASGIAWLAPWLQTQAMLDAAADGIPVVQPNVQATSVDFIIAEYAAQRDACLAERRGEQS